MHFLWKNACMIEKITVFLHRVFHSIRFKVNKGLGSQR